MKGTMMDFPLTLVSFLDRAQKLFSSVETVSRKPDGGIIRSNYGEFQRRSRALAAGLQHAGLKSGDRVATLMWNHATHLEAYFGVPSAGGILHTLNLRLHPGELAYIVNHAADRFLIVDDVLLPVLETIRAQMRFERIFVVPFSGKTSPALGAGLEPYDSLLEHGTEGFRAPAIEENQGAAMCYTSGTTGQPKGVIYSHRALVLHSFAQAMADSLAFSEQDVVMTVGSMFHANGWGFPYTATMVGAKQVFPGSQVDGESLLDLMAAEGVTLANGVPTIWVGVLDALEKRPGRWKLAPGLRVLSAGSAVPEFLFRKLDEHGIRMMHAWGMTETTPIASVSHLRPSAKGARAEEQYVDRARQGRTVPFVEMRGVNDDGEIPWDDQTVGELHVRGPWVAGSYYDFPEAQDRWTKDGWFTTGDVVTINSHGSIKIADRSKDMIKSGGEWISSVDLENTLMSHPAVKEAAVIGVPHPKWQERPLAVVVLREGEKVAHEELRGFLAARYAKWQLPDGFAIVAELPRTSVGKVMKRKLREEFQGWKWGDEKAGTGTAGQKA